MTGSLDLTSDLWPHSWHYPKPTYLPTHRHAYTQCLTHTPSLACTCFYLSRAVLHTEGSWHLNYGEFSAPHLRQVSKPFPDSQQNYFGKFDVDPTHVNGWYLQLLQDLLQNLIKSFDPPWRTVLSALVSHECNLSAKCIVVCFLFPFMWESNIGFQVSVHRHKQLFRIIVSYIHVFLQLNWSAISVRVRGYYSCPSALKTWEAQEYRYIH